MAGYDDDYVPPYSDAPYWEFAAPYANSYGDYDQPSNRYSESTVDSNNYSSSYHPSYPRYSDEAAPQETRYDDSHHNVPYYPRSPNQRPRKREWERRREADLPRPAVFVPTHHYAPTRPLTPIPTEPSQEYLDLSLQASTALAEPSSSRKLLIMDLNGTLIFRDTYKVRGTGQPFQQRVAHPRAYMPAFRQYIFHPETRVWLDTMVWSSAMPYNVDLMVEEAFNTDKGNLVAVWARDTLGLTAEQYNGKTQTTKDLAKPWAKIGIQEASEPVKDGCLETVHTMEDHPATSDMELSDDEIPGLTYERSRPTHPTPRAAHPPSPPSHTPLDTPAAETNMSNVEPPSTSTISPPAHSALSTLLLDDSPAKARLQPWNHFCITEYTAELRKKDVAKRQHEDAKAKAREQVDALAEDEDAVVEHSPEVALDGLAPRKRKREKKKKKEFCYDQTLLAVIGVLDTLKVESNVAGWMRRGGLTSVGALPEEEGNPGSGHDEEYFRGDHINKRMKLDENVFSKPLEDTKESLTPVDTVLARAGPDTPAIPELRPAPTTSSPPEPVSAAPPLSPADDDKPILSPPPPIIPVGPDLDSQDLNDGLEPHQNWFANQSAVRYWAERGQSALAALGISADSGI